MDQLVAKNEEQHFPLQLAVARQPHVKKVLGITTDCDPLKVVQIDMHVACSPRLRGKSFDAAALHQSRCAHRLSECLLDQQTSHMSAVQRASTTSPGTQASVVCLTAQWDETSHKLRPLLKSSQVRSTRMQVNSQVMVCSGHIIVAARNSSGHVDVSGDPWHNRPLRLENGSNTNNILEGLIKSIPVDFTKADDINEYLNHHEAFIFAGSMDRASPNLVVGRRFCFWLQQNFGYRAIYSAEPCAIHGTSLVKARCKRAKLASSALFSITRWLRINSNFDALAQALRQQVESKIRVRTELRPSELEQRSWQLIEELYGPKESDFFWRFNQRAKKTTHIFVGVSDKSLQGRRPVVHKSSAHRLLQHGIQRQ